MMMDYGLRMERLQLAVRQILSDARKQGMYLYGAGVRGRAALKNLEHIGFYDDVLGYIDDGQKYSGGHSY